MSNYIDLNWNPECSVVWAANKSSFETRFALLKWHKQEGGKVQGMPYRIGLEIAEFCKRGAITSVSHIAWDSLPGSVIYGIKALYADGTATIYLLSNPMTGRVVMLASRFEPKKIVPRGTEPEK